MRTARFPGTPASAQGLDFTLSAVTRGAAHFGGLVTLVKAPIGPLWASWLLSGDLAGPPVALHCPHGLTQAGRAPQGGRQRHSSRRTRMTITHGCRPLARAWGRKHSGQWADRGWRLSPPQPPHVLTWNHLAWRRAARVSRHLSRSRTSSGSDRESCSPVGRDRTLSPCPLAAASQGGLSLGTHTAHHSPHSASRHHAAYRI